MAYTEIGERTPLLLSQMLGQIINMDYNNSRSPARLREEEESQVALEQSCQDYKAECQALEDRRRIYDARRQALENRSNAFIVRSPSQSSNLVSTRSGLAIRFKEPHERLPSETRTNGSSTRPGAPRPKTPHPNYATDMKALQEFLGPDSSNNAPVGHAPLDANS
ncbi:uncharacterized protein M421DRAFT_135817 [Didymella exigua CBS 183.55]|uniref:Uncharacterized protein n=1 Tax=Didymella exigua CBS 183.55 TaxID=1150837 RepID=A0A6A5RNR3_9PLEO|nr:uncharacterized protein M421DRAFT_135817 [Didymella exigua CBS 183.55]KAF1929289.1 hypothetical protein M421DRAFT_135817 [Didymella exigua CBS 183.55]